jgi:large subunit ribosomal protein L4
MKCAVTTLDNKKTGEIDLADEVFALPLRRDILARMVNWQLAKRRAGTHKVQGRSDVTGSTRKRYRQKGSGRARIGSGKVSQYRGGGMAFGPVVRDHAHQLTKKVRKLALKTALSAKLADGKLVVLDAAKVDAPKTAELARKLAGLGWSSALVIDGATLDENFARAARNLPGIDVLPEQGANVHDILRRDTLVLTKDAVEALEARLK